MDLREEVKRRRKVHNEELHDLYCSPNNIKLLKLRVSLLVRYVTRMGEKRKTCSVLTGKPEGKGLLGMLIDRGGE